MSYWYVEDDSVTPYGWSLVTQWAASTAYSVGDIVRQLAAPSSGNERCFLCVVAGTSGGSEPSWTINKGGSTTDNTVTWKEVTGQPAVNGDATNTPEWQASTNYALTSPIIKNTAGTHYFIVTTDAGSSGGSEPTWDTTTGNTTSDSGITWTCIGAVGDFPDWGAPHASIETAGESGFASAGDTLYVSDRHSYSSSAAKVISFNGTDSNFVRALCVNPSSIPPVSLSTGASEGCNPANYTQVNGFAYMYGVTVAGGSSTAGGIGASSADATLVLEECTIDVADNTYYIGLSGANTGKLTNVFAKDCDLNYTASDHTVIIRGNVMIDMHGGALTGTAPTTAFTISGSYAWQCNVKISDMDLSLVTGNLFDVSSAGQTDITVSNCKLGAGVTPVTGSFVSQGNAVRFVNCDSADTNYRYYLSKYTGTVQQETTVVRTGGASDGTTTVSRCVITNANASYWRPLELDTISVWNETTGSPMTATVEIAGSAALNDDEIWLEIEYSSDASYPTYSRADDRRTILGTAAAQTTSAESWGGSPASTQKLSVTFTPQNKGPIIARVYVAKPSTTVYVDPKITLS